MKHRDYCCCAIPTVNAGIYAVLTEQLVLGVLVGSLAVAAPAIVGSESFTPWPLAIICYAAAAIQIFGFLGVARENNIIFRRYLTLHIFATLGAFAVSGAMIGISAGRHSTAETNCINDFFASDNTTSVSSLGQTLCNIFPWVDVGVMAGIWAILAISQFYFYIVISGYGSFQRDPRGKYDSVYSVTNLTGDTIPMADRSDPWNAQEPEEGFGGLTGKHGRTDSVASRFDQEPYTDVTLQTNPVTQDANNRRYNDPYYNDYSSTAQAANTGARLHKPAPSGLGY